MFCSVIENSSILTFLNVLIGRIQSFQTSVYRKPTFIGLFINFDSFIPFSFKRGFARTFT